MLACLLVAASSCDLIDYHPYDTRYSGPRQLNAKAIAAIEEKCDGRDSLCFAVISDTQRWYDETAAAVRSINAQGNVDFVIHCGDMTDFGLTREFEWMQRELDRLDMPCVCLIGNHDCLGTGSDMYHTIYGEPNFSFTAGDVPELDPAGSCWVWDFFARTARRLEGGGRWTGSLPAGGYGLYLLLPEGRRCTFLGRTDKYAGFLALETVQETKNTTIAVLHETGPVGWLAAQPPRRVAAGGLDLTGQLETAGPLCTLSLPEAPDRMVLEIDW